MVTDIEYSGSPPKRAPPPVPTATQTRVFAPSHVLSPTPDLTPPLDDDPSSPIASNVSKSASFSSTQVRELTVDDIDDFDDDDLEEVENIRSSRRNRSDAADLAVGLPAFVTGMFNVY